MWHSCVRRSLDELLASSTPRAAGLAKKYVSLLRGLGDVQIIPQKTWLVAVGRVRFAGMVPQRDQILTSFALRRRIVSPRIARHVRYGPRWQGHYVEIRDEADLDSQFRDWLRESYEVVGLQA